LGIKVHPDYQGTFFDDPSYIKIFKKAKELDLITLTHAGFDVAFAGQEIKCTPFRVLRVLDALGGYDKLVLAHMGGNELYDQVYKELAGERVYFDTSYVLPSLTKEQFGKMVEKHGEDKILFASDSPWQGQGQMVEIIKSYILGKDTENKILCENARKLLNI
jgi:predicted TIM-barrel fold metal-dependent hydrolase